MADKFLEDAKDIDPSELMAGMMNRIIGQTLLASEDTRSHTCDNVTALFQATAKYMLANNRPVEALAAALTVIQLKYHDRLTEQEQIQNVEFFRSVASRVVRNGGLEDVHIAASLLRAYDNVIELCEVDAEERKLIADWKNYARKVHEQGGESKIIVKAAVDQARQSSSRRFKAKVLDFNMSL